MKKLKIGILGTRGIPNHYGGFEQFAQYLSAGLSQRGHSVFVYNSSDHPYQKDYWNGVNIIHAKDLENKLGTFGQFFYDLNCINDARKRNFDVLLHLGYTSDSIWYWRWPKHTVNMVNVDGMEWQRSKYNKPTRRFLKFAEALAAKHAQVLVADSPRMQQHFKETYGKQAAFIPYGADLFTDVDPVLLDRYKVRSGQYFMLVARMEPENNIEMIIQGYLKSGHAYPLLIVGNTGNQFGSWLQEHYQSPGLRFIGPIYEQTELSNLRYFSSRYFHGHSVGGTNPSLLEAMACQCNIAAHANTFNQAVLKEDADYFSSADEVMQLINSPLSEELVRHRTMANIHRIETEFSKEKNIDDYEKLMLEVCHSGAIVLKPDTLVNPAGASVLRRTGETRW